MYVMKQPKHLLIMWMDRWVVMSNYQKIEFIIIHGNVKFNLNWYKYHGHEKTQFASSYPWWGVEKEGRSYKDGDN